MAKKILVVSGPSYYRAVKRLGEYSSNITAFIRNPTEFSLVVFTGGEDISPELYGDVSFGMCHYNLARDEFEQGIFKLALKNNIPMTGICRGVQFLNVMAGGKMIHHLDKHAGRDHTMATSCGEVITVNSLHHQMLLVPETAHVVGWSDKRLSSRYFGNNDELIEAPQKEVEAVIFPTIGAAGVQYHPEMMPEDSKGFKWYEQMVHNLMHSKTMDEMIAIYTSLGVTKCHATMSAG